MRILETTCIHSHRHNRYCCCRNSFVLWVFSKSLFFSPFLPLGCLSKLSSCSLKIRRLLGQIKICKLFNLFFVWLLRKLGKRKEKKLEFNAYSLSFVCCYFQMGADDFSFCFLSFSERFFFSFDLVSHILLVGAE